MQRQDNVFDQSLQLLRDWKFGAAFRLAEQAARNLKLYSSYKTEFNNIRLIAFEAHDWSLASEKLTVLLSKLSDELRSVEQ